MRGTEKSKVSSSGEGLLSRSQARAWGDTSRQEIPSPPHPRPLSAGAPKRQLCTRMFALNSSLGNSNN